MRGPRQRGHLAGASLNDLSSEEDTGSSSSDYEPDAVAEDQVTNNISHASSNGISDNISANIRSNTMQPGPSSTSSSNSSDLEEARNAAMISSPAYPQPGTSQDNNEDDRDLSQEEMDKLVQLQDLTGN